MRRKAVRITEEHEQRYRELANRGIIITQAIQAVQGEFSLDMPHNRQAVKRWAQLSGVTFKPAKRRQRMLDKQPKQTYNIEPLEAIKQWSLIIEQAKEAESLKEQVNRLSNILATKDNELEITRQDLAEVQDTFRRFRVAQQQKPAE